jgi:hypothetical protein
LDEDAPVSRQSEIKYFQYYQWPYYWTGGGPWGDLPYPPPVTIPEKEASPGVEGESDSENLRSVKEVMGYHIRAEDGDVGHVEDFILEEEVWVIRYMIVDTRNWLPGRKVLMSPGWIDSVDWVDRKVMVNLTVNAIKEGPEYDPSEPVNREYETRLYDYYGRPRYWG